MITVAKSDCEWYSIPYLDSHRSRQPVLWCCFQRIMARVIHVVVLPGHLATLVSTRTGSIASTRDSDAILRGCRWRKPRLGKSRRKDIAIHRRLAGPFQPTVSCMESLLSILGLSTLTLCDRSDPGEMVHPTRNTSCGFRNSQLQGLDLLVHSPSFSSFSQSLIFLPGFDHNGYW